MFYGWKLATIGSCGNLLLQGSVFYTMNAFIEPLVELHGWSRAGIGLSMTFASAMMTLSMPIGIMLTNKMSIRLLMTLGAFIGGSATLTTFGCSRRCSPSYGCAGRSAAGWSPPCL